MAFPKITIALRYDQAECTVQALEYVAERFLERTGGAHEPAVRLASNLAKSRVLEIINVINAAMEKA